MAEFKIPRVEYKDKPTMEDCYRELSHMTYQSPIEIVSKGFNTKLEGDVMKVIHSYGISVDKDELMKALQYDRNQYEKGFADGCRSDTSTLKSEVARDILSDLKKQIHEKAIYPHNAGIKPYISVREVDAIIQDKLKHMEERRE